MSVAYLTTAYLAPVQYYTKLASFDEIRIETEENYQKQSYRNRCLIASANGIQALTVPVEKPETQKSPTRDIRVSNHGNWRHLHWNALVSAYNMSPFFEYYADDFRPFYEKKYTFLVDYNDALQSAICILTDINPAIKHTTKYEPLVENDFRNVINPRHPLADKTFIAKNYYQVFKEKHGFLPNLSIVDLLFNMGPESKLLL
jgi:WbqC-like protein family.